MSGGKNGGHSLERQNSGGIPFLFSRVCRGSALCLGLLLVSFAGMSAVIGANSGAFPMGMLKSLFVKSEALS